MRVQRMLVPLSLALLGLSGCDVYDRWDGSEFNAGPVDASNFPPNYLGGGNRQRAGSGSFTAARLFVGEQQREHFIFPFAPTQFTQKYTALGSKTDALALRVKGQLASGGPAASAYLFDGCTAPEGYAFDADRDDVRYDEQGAIFTKLPTATYSAGADPSWSYVPVVERVPVTSKGQRCQSLKSEKTVVASGEVSVPLTDPVNGQRFGVPDGNYHAYAIIEPGAAVYHYDAAGKKVPSTGVGMQQWGWYNQFLLAYLDGGALRTREDLVGDVPVVRMQVQKLYYPRTKVKVPGPKDANGNPTTVDTNFYVGQGYDIVEAARNVDAAYTPVCEVFTYDTGTVLTPEQLPRSAVEVVDKFGATIQPVAKKFGDKPPLGDRYVYCMQLQ